MKREIDHGVTSFYWLLSQEEKFRHRDRAAGLVPGNVYRFWPGGLLVVPRFPAGSWLAEPVLVREAEFLFSTTECSTYFPHCWFLVERSKKMKVDRLGFVGAALLHRSDLKIEQL